MIHISEPTFLGNEEKYVADTMQAKWLSHGDYVTEFEEAFAERIGVRHALAVTSGTTALHLALVAMGVRRGDVVHMPTLTYASTCAAARYTGANVVLHDVDPNTWVMNLDEVPTAPRHVALPVHLYGVVAGEMGAHSFMLEDACEAHGAENVKGDKAGALGLVSVFSFYGNKILTCGEGGMVLTNDDALAARARHLHSMATIRRYVHDLIGFNYRMTNLQGAVGLAQVEQMDEHLRIRHMLEGIYTDRLATHPRVTLQTRAANSAPWMFPILVDNPESLAYRLETHGIETRPVFTPLHLQTPFYTEMKAPHAMRIAKHGLLLPLHASLTSEDVHKICTLLWEIL